MKRACQLDILLLRVAMLGLLGVGIGGCHEGGDALSPDGGIRLTPDSNVAMTLVGASVIKGHVAVDFRLTDPDGKSIFLDGFATQWTLAALTPDPATGASTFTNYITKEATGKLGTTQQPTSEKSGKYEDRDDGSVRYTFSFALPPSFDHQATHRIGAWTQKTVDGGTPEVANAIFDFVPAGGIPATPDVVATEACNACHSPLALHGGSRRDVQLCVTCHTPQLLDPNRENPAVPGEMNPLDLSSLVHRIHRGVDLPTLVAAQKAGIVGARFDVVGYMGSDSVFAETVAGTGSMPEIHGVTFPQDLRNCVACHQKASSADHWKTVVSRRDCASCHDNIWFGDPAAVPPLHIAHPAEPVLDDSACSACHIPESGEYDLSIAGAHTVPKDSYRVKGLTLEILQAAGTAGENPVVNFRVSNADKSVVTALADLDSLSVTIAGPTTDYIQQNNVRQDVRGAEAVGDGSFRYQFKPRSATDAWYPNGPAIASDAKGTFAAGIEGRRKVTLGDETVFEEGGNNAVVYFSIDGSPVQPRRTVVEADRCNACHSALRAHGNLRTNPEYCVMCHAPDATDWSQRPKGMDKSVNLAATVDGIEERSIRFSRMIHFIHTGDEIEHSVPFAVYGFGASVNRFDDVRFPGDRAKCQTCHAAGTFTIDAIPATAIPTVANETGTILHMGSSAHVQTEPPIPVIQSVCLSCHDSDAARTHVSLETTVDGHEACAVCHGEGSTFAVTAVHAGR